MKRKSWGRQTLAANTATITKGTTPTSVGYDFIDEGVPFVRVQDLVGGTVDVAGISKFVSQETNSALARSVLEPNDVLLSIAGTVGRVAIVPANAPTLNCNQAVALIRPLAGLDERYLAAWLATEDAQTQMTGRRVTGTISNLSLTSIGGLKIPLPPIEEQRRIAAVLDAVDDLRTKRRQALAKLDTLTQAIFIDMFGDLANNDRGWPVGHIGDVVKGFETGKSVAAGPDDAPGGLRVLKVSAVTARTYKWHESKPVPIDYEAPISHHVKAGDLLMSRANTTELVGACAFVTSTPPNHLLPDKLWRFIWRSEESADPLYIWKALQDRKVRDQIGDRASGSSGSMKNISQAKFLGVDLPMPPIELQRVFAKAVDHLDARAESLSLSADQFDTLFASLQQRAFAGEL